MEKKPINRNLKNLIFNRRGALCAPVGWIWFCFAGERSSTLRAYIIPFVVLAAAERTNLSGGEGFPLPQIKAFSTGGATPPLQAVDDVLLSNSDLSVSSPSGGDVRQKVMPPYFSLRPVPPNSDLSN